MNRIIARLNKTANKYTIYQMNYNNILWRDVLMGSKWLKKHDIDVSLDEYDKVYELEADNLDEVFYILNQKQPSDYRTRSLSVGDIVENNGTYYFVDSWGFVPDLIK